MVSLRFPFLFCQPQPPQSPRPFSAFAAAAAATAGATVAYVVVSSSDRHRPFLRNDLNSFFSSDHSLPLWGSLSLANNGVPVFDSKTGASFPSILEASQKLCGIGLQRKCILGLKNIDVYAFAGGWSLQSHLSPAAYWQLSLACLAIRLRARIKASLMVKASAVMGEHIGNILAAPTITSPLWSLAMIPEVPHCHSLEKLASPFSFIIPCLGGD